MSAAKPTFPDKATGDKLFATEINRLKEVAIDHADLIDALRALPHGTYTVQAGDTFPLTIPVPGALGFGTVGIAVPGTTGLDILTPGTDYTSAPGTLTLSASISPTPQAGYVVHYNYSTGTVSGGGGSYTLPAASATVRGGITVGQGLKAVGDVLSVKIDNNTLGYNSAGELFVLTAAGAIADAPTGFTAHFVGNNGGQRLDWNRVDDALLYEVYRQVSGGSIEQRGSVPFPYFNDTNDQQGNFVVYFVCTANSIGESARVYAITS